MAVKYVLRILGEWVRDLSPKDVVKDDCFCVLHITHDKGGAWGRNISFSTIVGRFRCEGWVVQVMQPAGRLGRVHVYVVLCLELPRVLSLLLGKGNNLVHSRIQECT
jgi:hypothetical protein